MIHMNSMSATEDIIDSMLHYRCCGSIRPWCITEPLHKTHTKAFRANCALCRLSMASWITPHILSYIIRFILNYDTLVVCECSQIPHIKCQWLMYMTIETTWSPLLNHSNPTTHIDDFEYFLLKWLYPKRPNMNIIYIYIYILWHMQCDQIPVGQILPWTPLTEVAGVYPNSNKYFIFQWCVRVLYGSSYGT